MPDLLYEANSKKKKKKISCWKKCKKKKSYFYISDHFKNSLQWASASKQMGVLRCFKQCKDENWKKAKYEMKILGAKHWAPVSKWKLFSRKTSGFTSDGILGSEGGTCSWNSWLTNQLYIHMQLSLWAAAGRRCTNGCKMTSWHFIHLRASVHNASLRRVSWHNRHRRAGMFILQSSCEISQLVQVLFYWRHICTHNLTALPLPFLLLPPQYMPVAVHNPSPSQSSLADTFIHYCLDYWYLIDRLYAQPSVWQSRRKNLFQHPKQICSHGVNVNVTVRPK